MKLLSFALLFLQITGSLQESKLHFFDDKTAIEQSSFASEYSDLSALSAFVIDSLDTVVFDFSFSNSDGTYLEFPVSINSDDSIFALDFSFRFNNVGYVFNSGYSLVPNINFLYYYNPSDFTFRFTSYCLDYLPVFQNIVYLNFGIIDNSFCQVNPYSIKAYLNGEPCSVKLTNCSYPTHLKESKLDFGFYPNPASEVLILNSPFKFEFEILEVNGSKVISGYSDANAETYVSLSGLANGIYLLNVQSLNAVASQKIVIQH